MTYNSYSKFFKAEVIKKNLLLLLPAKFDKMLNFFDLNIQF